MDQGALSASSPILMGLRTVVLICRIFELCGFKRTNKNKNTKVSVISGILDLVFNLLFVECTDCELPSLLVCFFIGQLRICYAKAD